MVVTLNLGPNQGSQITPIFPMGTDLQGPFIGMPPFLPHIKPINPMLLYTQFTGVKTEFQTSGTS